MSSMMIHVTSTAAVTGTTAATLHVDYRQGIEEGVRHLAAFGHTRIAFISGPPAQRSCELRRQAFEDSLAACDLQIEPRWMLTGDHTLAGGMEAMRKLLAQDDRPTAVMCSNDITAIGVLRTLASDGIAVPGEISVVGFDDIHLTEFVYPPLTTVRMSRKDLARGAFSLLRAQVEASENAGQRKALVPTSLTVRESTGPAPVAARSGRNRTRSSKLPEGKRIDEPRNGAGTGLMGNKGSVV